MPDMTPGEQSSFDAAMVELRKVLVGHCKAAMLGEARATVMSGSDGPIAVVYFIPGELSPLFDEILSGLFSESSEYGHREIFPTDPRTN